MASFLLDLNMLSNFLKIAWRSLWKNKIFSLINVMGLATGMAACLLILQYVNFELSYDRFHNNVDHIYRVINDRYQEGKRIQHGAMTYSAVGKALNDDFEEVIGNTRVRPGKEKIVRYRDRKLTEQRVLYADDSFLSIFTFPLIAGDASSALADPYGLILSETLAAKLFPAESSDFQRLIGKVLFLDRDPTPYRITGISRDTPSNSHLRFHLLVSYATLYKGMGTDGNSRWAAAEHSFTASDFWHYIQLKPGTDSKALETKLRAFSERHFQGSKVSGSLEEFYLQPLTDAHLYSNFDYEIGETGNAVAVWSLFAIALLIILVAWVNYVNLSIAGSIKRAKEVGVRKVAGATGEQLVRQFLTESILVNMAAFLMAVLLVVILQDTYNRLIQHPLSFSLLIPRESGGLGMTFGFVFLLISGMLVSGIYPALRLLSIKPATILKGKPTASPTGAGFRKALIVGQFAVATALISSSFIIQRQMEFMMEEDLGLKIDQVLIINPPRLTGWDSTYVKRVNSFISEIEQFTSVKQATTSWRVPGDELDRDFNVRRQGDDANKRHTTRVMGVSEGFTDLYGIGLMAGRTFRPSDFSTDWHDLHHIILNRTSASVLGFPTPEAAIGKKIMIHDKEWDIIGVVADFHQKSLHHRIEPTLLIPEYNENSLVSVKVDTQNITATISAIKEKYEEFFPGNLFDHYFLDNKFQSQYGNDRLFGDISGIFSGLAIVIACLGLLGLSLFDTARRNKEIGIRKVLGATVPHIMIMLLKDVFGLVIIAILFATPIAWYYMDHWLRDFAFRIEAEWWIFALAGLSTAIVALLTVCFQSVKTALMNPVKSLRSE